MPAARALRDVFTDLINQGGGSGDPGETLRASGHADLPDGLVAEAVVTFADTAPIEVAEHLAPFVAANSPVPHLEAVSADDAEEPMSWLEALTSAPVVTALDPGTDLDAADLPAPLDQATHPLPEPHGASDEFSDFGIGDLDIDPTAGLDAAGEIGPATPSRDDAPLDAPLDVASQPAGEETTIDGLSGPESPTDESPEQAPDEPFDA